MKIMCKLKPIMPEGVLVNIVMLTTKRATLVAKNKSISKLQTKETLAKIVKIECKLQARVIGGALIRKKVVTAQGIW